MTNQIRAAAFLDKGGTGKTTTVAHLGVALARDGLDVLLIDLAGKQGDLAKHFGVWGDVRDEIAAEDDWPNVATVFDDRWSQIGERLGGPEAAAAELVVATGEGPDLIPAHPGLDSLDADLGNIDDAEDRYSRLRRFLDDWIDPLRYDAVLVDLPGLSNNVSYNGIWACGNVLAPVEMGPFESEQSQLLAEDLQKMIDAYGIAVKIAMVLPNKVDRRTKLADQYLEAFADAYPDAIAPEPIPMSQDIRNAAEAGQTAFAIEEPSQTAQRAREAFEADARALTERLP